MLLIEKIQELKGHLAAIFALGETEAPYILSGGADRHVIRWNLNDVNDASIIAKTPLSVYVILEVPSHGLLFIGTAAGEIHVVDMKDKKELKILKNHSGKLFDLKFDNNKLYSAGEDGKITITDISSLLTEKVIQVCNEKIRSMAIFEDQMALACGDGFIRILNLNTHKLVQETKAHEKACNVVKFHPTQQLLLSGGWDAHLKIWDRNLNLLKSIPAHNYAIYSIVFSPNKKWLATGSRDKTIKIWDAQNPQQPKTIDAEKYNGHRFSVNKILWDKKTELLYSTGDDKKLMIWKITEV